jgi:hypothetical protein
VTRLRSSGRRWAPLLTLLISLYGTGGAMAQRPATTAPDAIPRELVTALLANEMRGTPEFLIGSAPVELADRIPKLSGARILGSMVAPSSTTIVLEVPLRADSVRQLLSNALPAVGWEPWEQVYDSWGGFRPASSRYPATYCREGNTLSYRLTPRSNGPTLVSLDVRRQRLETCGARPQRVAAIDMQAPTLVDPPQSASNPCWQTRSSGFFSRSASTSIVHTSVSPELLMDYYGRQLADSGWTVRDDPDSSRVLTRVFEKPDSVTDRGGNRRVRILELRMTVPAATPECRLMELGYGVRGQP